MDKFVPSNGMKRGETLVVSATTDANKSQLRKVYPKSGQTYTFREMCEKLELRDSPHLGFLHNGMSQVVQDSHCGQTAMLELPLWADSRWTYKYETDEWIPVFRFAADNTVKIEDLCVLEPLLDPHAAHQGELWAVPKGTERKQNYRLVPATDEEPAYLVSEYSEIHWPVPQFDEDGLSEAGRRDRDDPGVCDDCDTNVEVRVTYKDFEEGSAAQPRHVCKHCKAKYDEYRARYGD